MEENSDFLYVCAESNQPDCLSAFKFSFLWVTWLLAHVNSFKKSSSLIGSGICSYLFVLINAVACIITNFPKISFYNFESRP